MREVAPPPIPASEAAPPAEIPTPQPEPMDRLQPVLDRLATLLERAMGRGAEREEDEHALPDAAPWMAPPLHDHVVQELRFSTARSGPGIAWRVLEGRVQALEGALALAPGARLSFNAYLNCFYEHYWSSHAPLEELELRLFGTGTLLVEAFRSLPDGTCYLIGRQRLRLDPVEGGVARIALDPSPAGAGRVFFDVSSPGGAAILAGRMETPTPPLRPVHLGIALCTFNRERMLLRNLQLLLDSPYVRWAQPRIVIVNQGKPFASEGMAVLLAEHAGRVTVVEQGNLGGTGGFTRAAMEVLRAGDCSHVLFMDDDIEFDPAVLVTTHAFAARTQRPTVVGGAMVDLYRPATMYEAGAVIDETNILRARLHNRPLHEFTLLDELSREVPCHFNGWWYCAVPAELFEQHGLPLPVFIRGDDMEFGARLHTAGVPTVCLPPISVWHEPFYAKPPGWQRYYDLRNRLIFAACHPELVRLDATAVLLRRLIDSLLKHDYQHAELLIRAVEDFLAGPAVLDLPMDVRHQEIASLAAKEAPARPASTVGMAPACWRPPPFLGWRQLMLAFGLAALWFGKVRRRARPELIFVDQWHPWMTMGVARYGLADRMHSFVQVFTHDRQRMRSALRRGLVVLMRYAREGEAVAVRWRGAQPELRSAARWERILGLAPRAVARAPAREEVDAA